MTTSDDEYQLTPKFQRFFYNELQQKDNSNEEHFNDVIYRRTTTPSSRDSGIPIPSSSSCCSSISEEQNPLLEFYLHPPINNSHSISEAMSSTYNSSPDRYQFNRRTVHWNDQSSDSPSKEEIIYNNSDIATITKCGPQISVNASLPFHSKLNIRIHANRINSSYSNENNQIKSTATVQRLTPDEDYKHYETLRQSYIQHYSTLTPNENNIISSPVEYYVYPEHRQMSIPISLPVDQRLVLYIRDGEVLARC